MKLLQGAGSLNDILVVLQILGCLAQFGLELEVFLEIEVAQLDIDLHQVIELLLATLVCFADVLRLSSRNSSDGFPLRLQRFHSIGSGFPFSVLQTGLTGLDDGFHLLEDGILALQVCLQLLRSLRGDLRFARLILGQQFLELLLQGFFCLFRFFINFFGLFVEAILELIHLFFNLRYVLRQEVLELLDDLLSGACHSFKTFCAAKLQKLFHICKKKEKK